MRTFGFAGWSGSGKTTLIEQLIPRFVKQAVLGQPITVYGAGSQTRCFVHVADVVPALARLIEEPDAFGRLEGRHIESHEAIVFRVAPASAIGAMPAILRPWNLLRGVGTDGVPSAPHL